MKRLMTTLIFVLLGWTGLCLADGVTVSGTVTGPKGNSGFVGNVLLLGSDGNISYAGNIYNDDASFTSRYSIDGVTPGTYTIRLETWGIGQVLIHEDANVAVPAGGLTHDITASNDDNKQSTHLGIQLDIKSADQTAIAGATVTCTVDSKEMARTADKNGKAYFFVPQNGFPYTFTAKAPTYQDGTCTLESMTNIWMEGNTITMEDAPSLQYVTLSGDITMAPAGATYPDGVELQLETTKGPRYATPADNKFSIQGVPVGGEATISLYDASNTGKADNFAITSPAEGKITVTGNSETFTQNITVTKVAAIVKGTIKDAAALNPQPTVTLTKAGESTAAYQATAIGGAFSINGVKAGSYTVGVTLAGYQLKGEAPTVTVAESLADVTLTAPLELEATDVTITFKTMLGIGSGNNYIPLSGAVVKLFAKGADVAKDEPLETATADAVGQFTLTTTGKLGTEYILYVTHEKIKPCTLAVTATKAIMTDLTFTFEPAPMAIPTPTFTPNGGNVAPGTKIDFTLPESLDVADTYNDMAFILYVENNATVELKSDVATLMNAITGGIGGGPMAEDDETEPSATLPFKVGMYREGEWLIPVSISADASGAVVFRAILAVSEDMNTLLYSNEMTATFTVAGEVAKPTAPTFYVGTEAVEGATATVDKNAAVTLKNGYEAEEAILNPIYYKVNGTDADFDISDATVLAAEDFDALTGYDNAIVIAENQTIKAATARINPTDMTVLWSDITTVAFTVKEDEPTVEVATPTFSVPAGEVEKGTKVTIACTTDKAKIHYTMDGSEPTAQSTEYKEAVVIDKDLTLKAIAFVGENKSEVATAAYTVKTANEELELANVNVYPNPSDGEFTLDLPVAATVEVFASTGVLHQRVEAGAGVMTLNIDRSGIYFLRITADGRTTVKRVVVR